ncbi:MAG: 50S ribosomal protein L21 [Solirubrobacterales bacterium]|nr:50S ribosomal protein L21 [Solirubrobacterales bacterium]
MYAIIKTGGKQYRVQEGQSLLVERLPADDGGSVSLQPLLVVDGSRVVDGDDLAKVSVQARVVGHERGPKLRIVKFKPKRGYKRRTGHRQELTRIEVTGISVGARRARAKSTPKAGAPAGGGSTRTAAKAEREAGSPSPGAATKAPAPEAPIEAPSPEDVGSGAGAAGGAGVAGAAGAGTEAPSPEDVGSGAGAAGAASGAPTAGDAAPEPPTPEDTDGA